MIKGFAQGAGFLGPVENCNAFAALREDFQEVFDGEGTVQADFDQADFFSLLYQVVNGLLNCLATRTHGDDHAFRIGRANIIKGLVAAPGQGGNLLHHASNDIGNSQIVGVGCFAALEINVGVLRCTALVRMLRIEGAFPEILDRLPIHQLGNVFVVDDINLLDLMGGPETIKEMQEGNMGFDGA